MIVVMRRDAKEQDIEHMIKQVESLGLKPTVLRGTERTVIAAIGDERNAPVGILESGPGVDEVLPVLAPYKLASLETKVRADRRPRRQPHRRRRHARRHRRPLLRRKRRANRQLGPRDQEGRRDRPPRRRVQAAHQPLQLPRPQGRGPARCWPPPATKPASPSSPKSSPPKTSTLVAEYADVLQIGARNMQNYRLLEAVGQTDRAVLLKRGPSATVEELLLAAEYILDGGNQQVMLCERGIRTFEAHTRFTLPLATVPYLHAKTHLPVVVDPSHGTGHTPLVPAMARAAIAAGADGLIVEVHPNPEKALSDGYQSLTFKQFDEMMTGCRKVAAAMEMRM